MWDEDGEQEELNGCTGTNHKSTDSNHVI